MEYTDKKYKDKVSIIQKFEVKKKMFFQRQQYPQLKDFQFSFCILIYRVN